MGLDELSSSFSEKISELETLWQSAKKEYASSAESISAEVSKLREENKELQSKYNEAQAKVDKIESQLANTIDQMKSMSKATDKGIDAMQLLDVYLVLMENVFESQVHTRLLIMLHGAKNTYKLHDLATAAGISGIQVRQAVFDLRNAGILEYNEETEEVSLKMRFLE